MKLLWIIFFVGICAATRAQYADIGMGTLQNKIWWFNWKDFTMANGATRSFTLDDGLIVTITFQNVTGSQVHPNDMLTWNGALLYQLYNFLDTTDMPALYYSNPTKHWSATFSVNVTAARNGVPQPFSLVAADAASTIANQENITLNTSGGNWQTIDFFKNSSQTANPLQGCGTSAVIISGTYGGASGTGESAMLSTDAVASAPLDVDVNLQEIASGGIGVAFGILEPVDRGDLPTSYGYAYHKLAYNAVNACAFNTPYPALVQSEALKIGYVAGDADPINYSDDNEHELVDEDGISNFPVYDSSGVYNLTVPVTNVTGNDAYLTGWFDYNRNGTFEANEFVTVTVPNNAQTVNLHWTGLPSSLPRGGVSLYGFRFRLSSNKAATQNATGFAPDGEVEDYFVSVDPKLNICEITPGFSFTQDLCNPLNVYFNNETPDGAECYWDFGAGKTDSNNLTPNKIFPAYGSYPVKLVIQISADCVDSVTENIVVRVDNEKLINTHDTSICKYQSVQLNAVGATSYCWSPALGLSATDVANPVATITQNEVYYVNAQTMGSNLITNGDFSQGDTSFKSSYLQSTTGEPDGVYTVAQNPSAWFIGMQPCVDHTTGTGNMLMVSGTTQPNLTVWSETVAVQPDSNYHFSVWTDPLSSINPSQLAVLINGNIVASILLTNANPCEWRQVEGYWNAGEAQNATISVVNFNTTEGGNDFALDDISFSQSIIKRDSVVVNMFALPVISISADTSICTGGTAYLTASAVGRDTYKWHPSGNLTDSLSPSTFAKPSSTTRYYVVVVDSNFCLNTDSSLVTVSSVMPFSISNTAAKICIGDTVRIAAAGGDTYHWYPEVGIVNPNSPAITVSPDSTTVYQVVIINSGCKVEDTLTSLVTVTSKPDVSISKSNDVDCFTGQVSLTANGGVNYVWSPSSTLDNPFSPTPVASPLETTTYYVQVSENEHCVAEDSIQVKVLANGENGYLLASAFTPNGDGKNDCFGVKLWGGVKSIDFSIYNRWGQRVFHTNTPYDCWDGTYNATPQQPGTFLYFIKATTICGPVTRKGTVTLIR